MIELTLISLHSLNFFVSIIQLRCKLLEYSVQTMRIYIFIYTVFVAIWQLFVCCPAVFSMIHCLYLCLFYLLSSSFHPGEKISSSRWWERFTRVMRPVHPDGTLLTFLQICSMNRWYTYKHTICYMKNSGGFYVL